MRHSQKRHKQRRQLRRNFSRKLKFFGGQDGEVITKEVVDQLLNTSQDNFMNYFNENKAQFRGKSKIEVQKEEERTKEPFKVVPFSEFTNTALYRGLKNTSFKFYSSEDTIPDNYSLYLDDVFYKTIAIINKKFASKKLINEIFNINEEKTYMDGMKSNNKYKSADDEPLEIINNIIELDSDKRKEEKRIKETHKYEYKIIFNSDTTKLVYLNILKKMIKIFYLIRDDKIYSDKEAQYKSKTENNNLKEEIEKFFGDPFYNDSKTDIAISLTSIIKYIISVLKQIVFEVEIQNDLLNRKDYKYLSAEEKEKPDSYIALFEDYSDKNKERIIKIVKNDTSLLNMIEGVSQGGEGNDQEQVIDPPPENYNFLDYSISDAVKDYTEGLMSKLVSAIYTYYFNLKSFLNKNKEEIKEFMKNNPQIVHEVNYDENLLSNLETQNVSSQSSIPEVTSTEPEPAVAAIEAAPAIVDLAAPEPAVEAAPAIVESTEPEPAVEAAPAIVEPAAPKENKQFIIIDGKIFAKDYFLNDTNNNVNLLDDYLSECCEGINSIISASKFIKGNIKTGGKRRYNKQNYKKLRGGDNIEDNNKFKEKLNSIIHKLLSIYLYQTNDSDEELPIQNINIKEKVEQITGITPYDINNFCITFEIILKLNALIFNERFKKFETIKQFISDLNNNIKNGAITINKEQLIKDLENEKILTFEFKQTQYGGSKNKRNKKGGENSECNDIDDLSTKYVELKDDIITIKSGISGKFKGIKKNLNELKNTVSSLPENSAAAAPVAGPVAVPVATNSITPNSSVTNTFSPPPSLEETTATNVTNVVKEQPNPEPKSLIPSLGIFNKPKTLGIASAISNIPKPPNMGIKKMFGWSSGGGRRRTHRKKRTIRRRRHHTHKKRHLRRRHTRRSHKPVHKRTHYAKK